MLCVAAAALHESVKEDEVTCTSLSGHLFTICRPLLLAFLFRTPRFLPLLSASTGFQHVLVGTSFIPFNEAANNLYISANEIKRTRKVRRVRRERETEGKGLHSVQCVVEDCSEKATR